MYWYHGVSGGGLKAPGRRPGPVIGTGCKGWYNGLSGGGLRAPGGIDGGFKMIGGCGIAVLNGGCLPGCTGIGDGTPGMWGSGGISCPGVVIGVFGAW